jgi:hypothetical protein
MFIHNLQVIYTKWLDQVQIQINTSTYITCKWSPPTMQHGPRCCMQNNQLMTIQLEGLLLICIGYCTSLLLGCKALQQQIRFLGLQEDL